MPPDVYTYSDFSIHLSAILGRHPKVTSLRLQLLPPATDPRPPLQCRAVQGSRETVQAHPSVEDNDLDFTTLYAVLLARRDDDDGNSELVAVYPVVGHVSHISLHWCAQLQRSLSVTSLLAAPTRSLARHADSFQESESGPILGRESITGVSTFEVQMSPYVPPLQWCRAVDGIFGSHHFVCSSYACGFSEPRDDDDSAGSAYARESWEAKDSLRTPHKAAVDAAAANVALRTPSAGPPMRMPRRESTFAAVWDSTPAAEAASCCSSTLSSGHLPLRVGGVLNGSVPLDGSTSTVPGTRVLCLIALDGALLTGRASHNPPSLSWSPADLFHAVCDFMSHDVMPRVSLRLINGVWARAEASERLLDDVCQVRQVLGASYVVQYPSDAAGSAAAHARSIVIVLDLSAPLQQFLSTLPSLRTCSLSPATNVTSEWQRRCLAVQFAEAVEDTIGQLVSQHPDVFAFTRETAPTTESALAVQLSRGPAQFTREMHCRSIAASVSQILSLSSNVAFVEEVVRLLWGCETDVEGTKATPTTEHSRESLRVLKPHPAQIQRRIEERLLNAIPP
ncbi:hypothetical protein, conserved [Leishmania tarentolae]|uniref:Uncharacterized protein n=1 Tax=Leishmania tarentolae TaxID=5689 RepID=A0A640KS92_LEITA|nr:hypothetical protein, conserved [Leishmania tarentolae]